MKSYILKINSFKISEISNNDFNKYSLSARDYRKLIIKNNNIKKLSDFIEKEQVGKEIGSESYMQKSKYRFLKTVNITQNFLTDFSSIEYCKPENKVFPQFGDILISKDGGGDGLGECSIYNFDNSKKLDSLSSGILSITIDNSKKYYILGFLKNNHFKNFVDLNTAQGSTIRHSKKIALDYKIPFPSKNNNENPENVEKFVSLITQNIVNKEEQIKFKNKKIDELIEMELIENQKVNNFNYSFPKISEIKTETRLDTGLYEKEYKNLKSLIENYENGFYNLLDKYNENRGQNLQVSQIGLSIYSNEYKNNFYRLLTNTELTDYRTISTFRYLGSKEKLSLIPKNSVILSADGTIGRSVFIDDLGNTTTNIHPWILIKKENNNDNIFESIFLSCFLSYLKDKDFYEKIKDKANGGGIKQNHLQRYIKIPNFPEEKQQEIAMQYYNKIDKNTDLDLDLDNYLQKEFERNSKLGIFQLNMELFDLREQLEYIIDKIIMDENIDIDF